MNGEERSSVSSEFGKVLRRHRLAAGLSQEALAERARMSSFAISALERGYRRRPQRKTLALLVDALTLDEQQRLEFEAAAAGPPVTPRHRPSDFVGEQPPGEYPSHNPITPNPSLAHVEIGPFRASVARPMRPVAVAIVLVVAVSITGILVLNRSKSSDEKSAQTVTSLGPFQFDISSGRSSLYRGNSL
jgi:transcriptional regulator with XRE-family HTH domain